MSGAEALAVIGMIANIVQLVDFSSRAISRVREYGAEAQDIPKTLRDIHTNLPLIAKSLDETGTRVKSGQVAEERCKALIPVLENCKTKLTELESIFEKFIPKDGASTKERVWKGLRSLRHDKEVEDISQALWRSLQVLMHYHVVGVPTIHEIEAVIQRSSSTTLAPPSAVAGKTYFMVPTLSSDDFVGREDTLAQLEAKLCLPDKYCRVAVVGLGGIG